jgi:hypothetical protein
MAFMASDNLEEGITQETVEMEVLIARQLILFEFSAVKKVAAIPGVSRKWGPKMETTAISESTINSGSPIRDLIWFRITMTSSLLVRDTQKRIWFIPFRFCPWIINSTLIPRRLRDWKVRPAIPGWWAGIFSMLIRLRPVCSMIPPSFIFFIFGSFLREGISAFRASGGTPDEA